MRLLSFVWVSFGGHGCMAGFKRMREHCELSRVVSEHFGMFWNVSKCFGTCSYVDVCSFVIDVNNSKRCGLLL